MPSVISAITNTVPISMFNRGQAGRIFADVKQSGAKVVMKNNIAECVLLSPETYKEMIDELEDMRLAVSAAKRLEHMESSNLIPAHEVHHRLGISQEDLDNMEDVDIE